MKTKKYSKYLRKLVATQPITLWVAAGVLVLLMGTSALYMNAQRSRPTELADGTSGGASFIDKLKKIGSSPGANDSVQDDSSQSSLNPSESTNSEEDSSNNSNTESPNQSSNNNQEALNNDNPANSEGSSGGSSGSQQDNGNNSGSGGGAEPDPEPDPEPEPEPEPNTPPSAPSGAYASYVSSSSVAIRANRATDSDGILRHELLRNGAVIKTTTSTANQITITDTNPVSGQTYSYAIRAVDNLGATGANSNSVSVTVPSPDTTPPTLPANFRVIDNSPGSVTFSWDASTDDQTNQEDIWYIISSPEDESDYYTWTRIIPHQTYWFDQPGQTHEVYIQAIDNESNVTAKVGPVIFTAQ